MPVFGLRIDIDTIRCLKEGVPNLLRVLAKHDLKASFYCPMGWEGDFVSVFKNRFIRSDKRFKREKTFTATQKTGTSLAEYFRLARTLFLPQKFLDNVEILKRIIDEGHELGVHGYVHARWRCPTRRELEIEFQQMVGKFEQAFGVPPAGLAAPLFQRSEDVLELCDHHVFSYASFMGGDKPFYPQEQGRSYRHMQIPVTLDIMDQGRMLPLLYFFALQDDSDDRILRNSLQTVEEKMKKQELELYTMHIHPKDEGIGLVQIFEPFIAEIKGLGLTCMTFREICQKYRSILKAPA